jgi:hypothetical protein
MITKLRPGKNAGMFFDHIFDIFFHFYTLWNKISGAIAAAF